MAAAQTTAYTEPMGGSVVTIAKSTAGGVFISCPYIHENEFVGEVTGVVDSTGTAQVSVAGTPFVSGSFNESALFPLYYLEVTESGHPSEGYAFDIISNSTSSVVIAAEAAGNFGLTVGDAVQIRKHMTLSDYFADAESSFVPFGDTVKFFNQDGSLDFYTWTGSMWSPDFGTTDVGHRQIYPGEGFLLTLKAEVSFLVSGKVKTTKTIFPVPASSGIVVFMGSSSPVTETLGSLGLASAGLTDIKGTVKFFSEDGSLTALSLFTDWGSYMTNDFGSTDGSGTIVLPGSALQVSNGSTGTNLVIPAPYSP